jgi:DMSO/TMAO reductase YedYZ molybdopterin-dependent catalytic subunit
MVLAGRDRAGAHRHSRLDAIAQRGIVGGPLPALPGGQLLGTLPLGGGRRRTPLETLLGRGLDARLFTDLSTLSPDTLTTPNDRFYVRTAAPAALNVAQPWRLSIGGLVSQARDLPLDSLSDLVRPLGQHLIECAGNTDPANFGLMSAASWDGIPVQALLDRAAPRSGAHHVLIAGVDDPAQSSRDSVAGASWIFSRDDLDRAGVFLATRMNGEPLPRHHGYPVRLIVPGWYGCACIKWVDRVEFVDEDAPPTSQMVEFADRTHQEGEPRLAREFTPAVIDLAAMPVRVEKWRADGRLVYRVIGIMWGGAKPTAALQIRFRASDAFAPVSDCPLPATTRTWSLWSHLWRPPEVRRYQIVLRVTDPSVRTRRLDLFFYAREVDVDEI